MPITVFYCTICQCYTKHMEHLIQNRWGEVYYVWMCESATCRLLRIP